MGCSQSSIQLKDEEPKILKRIETIIQSEDLDTGLGIQSLVEMEDKRIATGASDGNISISSYDINESKWQRDIFKEDAHEDSVYSLYALKGNKLLSGGRDALIKLWATSEKDITLIKNLPIHDESVFKIILLSNNCFASCSADSTVKIWKNDDTYECVSTLPHAGGRIPSILQSKVTNELVSSSFIPDESDPESDNPCISFWNLNNSELKYVMVGYGVGLPSHMIELPNGDVALSMDMKPSRIVIIDCSKYQVKKQIQSEDLLAFSSLCVLDQHSFIYAFQHNIFQISINDYSILTKAGGGHFFGCSGIIPIQGGKYFAIDTFGGAGINKMCFD